MGLLSRCRLRRVTGMAIILPGVLSLGSLLVALWFPSGSLCVFTRFCRDEGTNYDDNSSSSPQVLVERTTPDRHKANMVPQALLELGVYNETNDFVNEAGFVPTGWEASNQNPSIWGPCRMLSPSTLPWKNQNRHGLSNRSDEHSDEYYQNADTDDFVYQWQAPGKAKAVHKAKEMGGGFCRPGFLIIGQGKCGTSSLYHYLMGHPRVVPSAEKQIHYFKYYLNKPLEWYYGHFPSPKSFLQHGALMTGEASPGYMPYPGVARDVYDTYSGEANNGAGTLKGQRLIDLLEDKGRRKDLPSFPPRIIAIGREPLSRMYSSYKYNYVVPTIEHLRTKGHPGGIALERNIPDDDYYKPYLYTLEEFVKAELQQLKACIYDWGPAKTYEKWHRDPFYKDEIEDRNGPNSNNNNNESFPLIDLDGICYGDKINGTVFRNQWADLQMNNPQHKVLINKSLFLTQALLGRSLYVFPLEWWYLNYHQRQSPGPPPIFVCTEEMSHPKTLEELTVRLGLPKYDGFESIVAEGAYNVGGHRGYDKATSWEDLQDQRPQLAHTFQQNNITTTTTSKETSVEIPLTKDLLRQVQEFVEPLNERLFALTGKRCDW